MEMLEKMNPQKMKMWKKIELFGSIVDGKKCRKKTQRKKLCDAQFFRYLSPVLFISISISKIDMCE